MKNEKESTQGEARFLNLNIWDLGDVRQLTRGGDGPQEEENIVWGTEPLVFLPGNDE